MGKPTMNFSLFGIVEKTRTKLILSENYPTINFSHIPIYGKPARDDNSSLKIRIAGVKIDPAFITQAEVYLNRFENSKVKVRLLDKCESVLVGQVLSKEFFLWRKCLGSYLLRNGLVIMIMIVLKSLFSIRSNRDTKTH